MADAAQATPRQRGRGRPNDMFGNIIAVWIAVEFERRRAKVKVLPACKIVEQNIAILSVGRAAKKAAEHLQLKTADSLRIDYYKARAHFKDNQDLGADAERLVVELQHDGVDAAIPFC